MDRIALDRLIDEGSLVEAEESFTGFEELFVAANAQGFDRLYA